MATYPVYNKTTGETKEVKMSIHDWEQWCIDNPDWSRDWSDPSTAPMATDVGEWRDRKLLQKILDGTMFLEKYLTFGGPKYKNSG